MSKTKNLLERAATAILAVAMALVLLPASAFAGTAATTYKLTLTGTATGHTYEAYQIFTGDLSTNADGNKVLSNVEWGTGVTYTGTETAAEVAEKLAAGTMTLADLEDKLTLTTPAKTVQSAKDNTEIDDLAAGYYLVKDKDNTQDEKSDAYTKFIVQVVGPTSVAIKSGVPTVTKKVKDTNDSTGAISDWQDSADADINDSVSFQITGTLPSNYADYSKYSYVFTDTMSKGLSYTANSAVITLYANSTDAAAGTNGTVITDNFTENIADYSGTDTDYADGKVITWTEKDANGLKDIAAVTKDSVIVVTYTAKLNSDAKIGAEGNPNEVDLTYSNNPNKGGEGETGKTPKDKNIVFTYKATVNKVDENNNALAGAAFTLQKFDHAQNKYVDVKTVSADDAKAVGDSDVKNSFEFSGLDDGDYQLVESTTPAGYNTIEPIKFQISAKHETDSADPKLTALSGNKLDGTTYNGTFLTAELTKETNLPTGSLTGTVQNKKGSVLPSTGGMGTTMLYVGGAALAAVAAFGIYQLRKKENEA